MFIVSLVVKLLFTIAIIPVQRLLVFRDKNFNSTLRVSW